MCELYHKKKLFENIIILNISYLLAFCQSIQGQTYNPLDIEPVVIYVLSCKPNEVCFESVAAVSNKMGL
jgi:hypothetical protein